MKTKNTFGALRRPLGRFFGLFAALALTMIASPAMADLPALALPNGVNANDPIAIWRAVARIGLNVGVVVAGAWAFWKIGIGALSKWSQYQQGRAELTDLKEYFIYGVITLFVIVTLLTTANGII